MEKNVRKQHYADFEGTLSDLYKIARILGNEISPRGRGPTADEVQLTYAYNKLIDKIQHAARVLFK